MYLSLDSSANDCSVALLKPSHQQQPQQQWFVKQHVPRQHSQKMLPMLSELLEQAQLNLDDIEHFCYVRGPGSFTGVRIAASFIHGLALGQDKPVLGVSSLLVMAYEAYIADPQQSKYLVTLDARMQEVYFAFVDFNQSNWAEQLQERVLKPDSVLWQADYAQARLVGNGWQYLPQFAAEFQQLAIVEQVQQPDARFAGLLVQHCHQHNLALDTQSFPVYVRDNVTWDNKPAIGS